MQPHTMSSIAAAGMIWNPFPKKSKLISCKTVTNFLNRTWIHYVEIKDIDESGYSFTAQIKSDKTGSYCTVKVIRASTSRSSELEFEHDTNHGRSFKERCRIILNDVDFKIDDGVHAQSLKYRNFYSDKSHYGERFILHSEVRQNLVNPGAPRDFFLMQDYDMVIEDKKWEE